MKPCPRCGAFLDKKFFEVTPEEMERYRKSRLVWVETGALIHCRDFCFSVQRSHADLISALLSRPSWAASYEQMLHDMYAHRRDGGPASGKSVLQVYKCQLNQRFRDFHLGLEIETIPTWGFRLTLQDEKYDRIAAIVA